MSALFSPLKLRDTEFTNRVWVSPMCHYMATDGHVGPWHSAHLGALELTATALLAPTATTIPVATVALASAATSAAPEQRKAATAKIEAYIKEHNIQQDEE